MAWKDIMDLSLLGPGTTLCSSRPSKKEALDAETVFRMMLEEITTSTNARRAGTQIKAALGGTVEARLYGYERYGIEQRVEDLAECSEEPCMHPSSVLAETAVNLAYIASISPLPLRWVGLTAGSRTSSRYPLKLRC